MSAATENFARKVPGIMRQLMSDFGITDYQAGGVMGNLGAESLGLTAFQEINPTVPGSRGGWGWAQWTGPRRTAFEAYADKHNLNRKGDKANYAWLYLELKGLPPAAPNFNFSTAIVALKRTAKLSDAVRVFERTYEKAGVKNWSSRNTWSRRAMLAFNQAGGKGPSPIDTEPDSSELIAIKRIQNRLRDGFELDDVVGNADGIMGPKTEKGIRAFQRCRGGLAVDGIAGPLTLAELFKE